MKTVTESEPLFELEARNAESKSVVETSKVILKDKHLISVYSIITSKLRNWTTETVTEIELRREGNQCN